MQNWVPSLMTRMSPRLTPLMDARAMDVSVAVRSAVIVVAYRWVVTVMSLPCEPGVFASTWMVALPSMSARSMVAVS